MGLGLVLVGLPAWFPLLLVGLLVGVISALVVPGSVAGGGGWLVRMVRMSVVRVRVVWVRVRVVHSVG